jgi:hypothetical protein
LPRQSKGAANEPSASVGRLARSVLRRPGNERPYAALGVEVANADFCAGRENEKGSAKKRFDGVRLGRQSEARAPPATSDARRRPCREKGAKKKVRLTILGCPRIDASRSWFRHTSHFCTVAEFFRGSSQAGAQLSPLAEKSELFRLTHKEGGVKPYMGEVVAGCWKRPVFHVGLPRSRRAFSGLPFGAVAVLATSTAEGSSNGRSRRRGCRGRPRPRRRPGRAPVAGGAGERLSTRSPGGARRCTCVLPTDAPESQKSLPVGGFAPSTRCFCTAGWFKKKSRINTLRLPPDRRLEIVVPPYISLLYGRRNFVRRLQSETPSFPSCRKGRTLSIRKERKGVQPLYG